MSQSAVALDSFAPVPDHRREPTAFEASPEHRREPTRVEPVSDHRTEPTKFARVPEHRPATTNGACVVVGERYRLDHVPDDALHVATKALVGRQNVLTAELLAHLAEVEARGIHRERACSSLYTYCVYELRFSEDEAQRRSRAARAAREFPLLFEMLADGAIHMTGLLLLAPHLTPENHAGLLARARFRTKREIERLVAEVAPREDAPARIEPLGPLATRPLPTTNLWQAYTASLAGPVRELPSGTVPGDAPAAVFELPESRRESVEPAQSLPVELPDSRSSVPLRYRIEFGVSQQYVDLLEEARNLLQHRIPNRDVARVHELAMSALVEDLRRRRQAEPKRPETRSPSETLRPPRRADPLAECGSAPARMLKKAATTKEPPERHVPAAVRRAVWSRDSGRCTFTAPDGRRCRERAGLELHHEHAFALGGPTTAENLRLVCRSHNTLLAERDFGSSHMARWRKQKRLE